MKPIATVRWEKDGKEYSRSHTYLPYLKAHIRQLQEQDIMFLLFVTCANFPIPSVASKNARTSGGIDRRNETITAI